MNPADGPRQYGIEVFEEWEVAACGPSSMVQDLLILYQLLIAIIINSQLDFPFAGLCLH